MHPCMDDWISVQDGKPDDGEVVLFVSEATAGITMFCDGDFEYNRETMEYASVAGMGTPDKILKWKRINE